MGKLRLLIVRCAEGMRSCHGQGEIGAKREARIFLWKFSRTGEKRAGKKLDIDEAGPKYYGIGLLVGVYLVRFGYCPSLG